METAIAMNIYARLGARQLTKGQLGAGICVYPDGSASDETKAWALRQMGFVDTDDYSFDSWCEAGDRSALAPFKATTAKGEEFRLHPIPGGDPGCFEIEYGRFGSRALTVDRVYNSSEMARAISDALAMAAVAFESMPARATDNPRTDDRFTLEEDGWHFEGVPCRLITFSLAGQPTKQIPKPKA